jgi:hypothetical protein
MKVRNVNWARHSVVGLGAILLAACSGQQSAPSQVAAAPAAPAIAPVRELPVSLNAVMVGMVDNASDPLFEVGNAVREGGAGKAPKTDDDWRNVEYHAYEMIVSGRIMQIPGTGPKDKEWTSDPAWKSYADVLTDVGFQMLQKAQAKSTDGFAELGDKLVDACESCHKVFKPSIPTMRIMHKPDPDVNLLEKKKN